MISYTPYTPTPNRRPSLDDVVCIQNQKPRLLMTRNITLSLELTRNGAAWISQIDKSRPLAPRQTYLPDNTHYSVS